MKHVNKVAKFMKLKRGNECKTKEQDGQDRNAYGGEMDMWRFVEVIEEK